MTKPTGNPDLYVLDSLANDVEDLEGILRMLNSDSALGWKRELGRGFTREDVVSSLSRLVRDDLVRVLVLDASGKALEGLPSGTMPNYSFADAYFAITPRGRIVHDTWTPNGDTGSGTSASA